MRIGFAFDECCLAHDTGVSHPERAARLVAVSKALEGLPLVRVAARDATLDEIGMAHDARYVEWLRSAIENDVGWLDPDTVVCRDSWRAAVRAAGAGLRLAEMLLAGEIDGGFAGVRPPGHHATRSRAMGFCLLNNVAIAARFLASHGKQVAILDWDVHHGNGTIDILQDDRAVPIWNLREEGLWPVPGDVGPLPPHVIDVPLPPGSGDEEYLRHFDAQIAPALRAHAPEILLVSAGFDAHASDPLSHQRLSTEAYRELTLRIAGCRVISFLEGGYHLQALADSVRAHVGVLLAA
ncbi:MAG: histone deacetylase [Planctomycetota bacterium]